jgi:hypothetical protein
MHKLNPIPTRVNIFPILAGIVGFAVLPLVVVAWPFLRLGMWLEEKGERSTAAKSSSSSQPFVRLQ